MNQSHFSFVAAIAACALSAQAAGDVDNWGKKFTPETGVTLNVPPHELTKLPDELPVYGKTSTVFTAGAVEWIIDNAVTDAGMRTALKQKIADTPSMLKDGSTTLNLDEHFQLVVNPSAGIILFSMDSRDAANKRLTAKQPEQTNYVALETFHASLRAFIPKLGIHDTEIERKPDGDYKILASDGQRYPNHQKETVLYVRSVKYNRQSKSGFPMTSGTTAFTVDMERFIDGEWKKIFVNWPTLSTNGFVHTLRTQEALKTAIASGKALWDHNNEFDPAEAEKITVTGIRIVYSTAANGNSSPIFCLDCEAKTKRGNEYAVIFVPLVDFIKLPAAAK